MSETSLTHQQSAAREAGHRPVRCAVLTVSDTRTLDDDVGGPLIERFLREARHQPIERAIVKDEPGQIAARLESWLGRSDIDAILTTGGTGIVLCRCSQSMRRRIAFGAAADRAHSANAWLHISTRLAVRLCRPRYEVVDHRSLYRT